MSKILPDCRSENLTKSKLVCDKDSKDEHIKEPNNNKKAILDETQIVVTEVYELFDSKTEPARLKEFEMVKVKTMPINDIVQSQTHYPVIKNNIDPTGSSSDQGFNDEESSCESDGAKLNMKNDETFSKDESNVDSETGRTTRTRARAQQEKQKANSLTSAAKSNKDSGVDAGTVEACMNLNSTFTRDEGASSEPEGRTTRTRARLLKESSVSEVSMESTGPSTRTRQAKQAAESASRASLPANADKNAKDARSPRPGKKRPVEERGLSPCPKRSRSYGITHHLPLTTSSPKKNKGIGTSLASRISRDALMSPRRAIQEQKKSRMIEKENRDRERLKKAAELKQRRIEELKRQREEKERRVAEVREQKNRIEQEQKDKMTKKFEDQYLQTEKLLEARLKEEKERQKLRPGKKRPVEERGLSPCPKRSRSYGITHHLPLTTSSPKKNKGIGKSLASRISRDALMSPRRAIQEQKKSRMIEKENRDRERLKKAAELKQRRIEELKRQREEKERRVAEVREQKNRIEQEQKDKMTKKFEDQYLQTEKLLEARLKEEKERQKLRPGKKRPVEERGLSPCPKRSRSYGITHHLPLTTSSPKKNKGIGKSLASRISRDALMSPRRAIQEQKKSRMIEKENRDRERLKKAAELKQRRIEELKRQREEKERRVAEVREQKNRIEQEQKDKMTKKFEDQYLQTEKLLEARLKEEKERQKLRPGKKRPVEERGLSPCPKRSRSYGITHHLPLTTSSPKKNKGIGTSLASRISRDALMSPRRAIQEQKKSRMIEKENRDRERLKKAAELKQRRIEELKRQREEKERRVAEVREQKNRIEQEQKDKMTKKFEDQYLQTEKLLEARLKEEKERQKLRLQKQMEADARRKQEEEERQKRFLEQEKECLKRQEEEAKRLAEQEALKQEFQKMINKHNSSITHSKPPPPASANVPQQSSTSNNKKQPTKSSTSYDMTPVKVKSYAPMKDPDNYDIDGKESDKSTDDKEDPKKVIPSWALGIPLNTALIRQFTNPPDLDAIFRFDCIEPPDLEKVFAGTKKRRYKERTSSAIWKSPVGAH